MKCSNNVVHCTLFVIAVVTSHHFRCILSPINTFFPQSSLSITALVTPFTINGRYLQYKLNVDQVMLTVERTVVQSNYLLEYQTNVFWIRMVRQRVYTSETSSSSTSVYLSFRPIITQLSNNAAGWAGIEWPNRQEQKNIDDSNYNDSNNNSLSSSLCYCPLHVWKRRAHSTVSR